jgi:DNA invertase Pin-like site-specific DNA recombinase
MSVAISGADTATSTGWLMIAILGGLADVERDLIRTRTAATCLQFLSTGLRAIHAGLTSM